MNLSLCSYLLKIILLDAEKLIYKTPDNKQIIYKSKSCRAAEEFCKFSMERKVALPSSLVVRWLEVFAQRTPHPLDGNWFVRRSLFPRKEEIVDAWATNLESGVSG